MFAGEGWISENATTHQCTTQGDIVPCFGDVSWGHRDYRSPTHRLGACRIPAPARGTLNASIMYVPHWGPQHRTWQWQAAQRGGAVPAHAVRSGDQVLARSMIAAPGHCDGAKFTGSVDGPVSGTFGTFRFALLDGSAASLNSSFQVAICPPVPDTPTPAPAPTPAPVPPPPNTPCVTWVPLNSSQPTPSVNSLFVAAVT